MLHNSRESYFWALLGATIGAGAVATHSSVELKYDMRGTLAIQFVVFFSVEMQASSKEQKTKTGRDFCWGKCNDQQDNFC